MTSGWGAGGREHADVSISDMAESFGKGQPFTRQLSAQRSIDSTDGVSLELELLQNVYMKDLQLSNDHR